MFKVGITKDFLTPEGELTYEDMGLDLLKNQEDISFEFMKEFSSPLTADLLKGYDAIISLSPAYTSESFKGVDQLKAICRFGVGYDMVDLKACTDANVLVTITKGAVNYSVAEATLTWMLTLSHNVLPKNQLVRENKWQERSKFTGSELRHKTLGIIGFGGIGGQLVKMLQPFRMNQPIVYDPFINKQHAEEAGVKIVDLQTLMSEADFISVNCPLTDSTRNLIGSKELSFMKRTAYIVNTARGGIINEEALCDALESKIFAGYATDVFEKEPADGSARLFNMNNVIMAPHCIAWTNELFKEIGEMACRQIIQVANGTVPDHVVNTDVLNKWKPKHTNLAI
ncbi:MAG: NAD(P)-dependent oxidoreductase [Agriterribacter sp.]